MLGLSPKWVIRCLRWVQICLRVRFRAVLKAISVGVFAAVALWSGPPSMHLAADVCVFGGSSAGVAAAVAAARDGHDVVLIAPRGPLGGMSASGIGLVDRGNVDAIGGFALEFYRAVAEHYGVEEAWRVEPGVAERIFRRIVAEYENIVVVTGSELETAVLRRRRIRSLRLESGLEVAARVFIDASYEGDLLAAAGVSYTVGREGVDEYGESLAGIRPRTATHQFLVSVDPYVRKGDPSSGLLPGIDPAPMGAEGDADASVQAYTYRLCLTKTPSNRVPIPVPDGYDAREYEVLVRYVVALQAAGRSVRFRDLVSLEPLPNGKYDLNSRGPFSTDAVGLSHEYPRAAHLWRREIEARHRNYLQGLLITLQRDPRLPQSLRAEAKQFGLAADEFAESDNWPPLLYVREARRMIGSYVVTQSDTDGQDRSNRSVGLASYMIDSHNCRRVAVSGRVRNEGDVQRATRRPFAIPYEALTPNPGQCENLLVPVCLSASHVAYGSIRMEPVLMILGESAGIAASMAVRQRTSVQAVDYDALRIRLLAAGQRVEPPNPR